MWFNLIAIAILIIGHFLHKYYQGALIASAIALCNFIF